MGGVKVMVDGQTIEPVPDHVEFLGDEPDYMRTVRANMKPIHINMIGASYRVEAWITQSEYSAFMDFYRQWRRKNETR